MSASGELFLEERQKNYRYDIYFQYLYERDIEYTEEYNIKKESSDGKV